jgi:hypothetical protein
MRVPRLRHAGQHAQQIGGDEQTFPGMGPNKAQLVLALGNALFVGRDVISSTICAP